MVATIVLWSGFALSVRGIHGSSLTPFDIATLRFTIPVILLSPWLPRAYRRLKRERPSTMLALCIGAGAPYFLICAAGGAATSAALVGIVIPGTVPLFVAGLSYALWRTRVRRIQLLALLLIVTGAMVSLLGAPSGAAVGGIAWLLLAGLVWAIYTLALRKTGLDPISATLVLCVPSAVVMIVLLFTGVLPSHLLEGTARISDAVIFSLVQGVGVGVLAAVCYAIALRHLSSAVAATLGALSPVLTLLLAVPIFHEPITVTTVFILVLMLTGVIGFNLASVHPAPHHPMAKESREINDPAQ